MAKVKCAACGETIDKKIAIGVPAGKRTKYYCPEHVGMKSPRETMYDLVFEIFGRKVLNTILYKELDEIAKVYSYELLTEYMKENKEYLEQCVFREYSSEYAQLRYFCAVIKNAIHTFKISKPKPIIKKALEIDMENPQKHKNQPKKTRAGMDSLLEDLL